MPRWTACARQHAGPSTAKGSRRLDKCIAGMGYWEGDVRRTHSHINECMCNVGSGHAARWGAIGHPWRLRRECWAHTRIWRTDAGISAALIYRHIGAFWVDTDVQG